MMKAIPHIEETCPARCGACGADEPEPLYPVRDLLWAVPGSWGFVRCRRCGHGYLSPRPSDAALSGFYNALYTPDNLKTMIQIGRSGFDQGLQKARVSLIRAAVRGPVARVLDVGCGVGFFLQRMKQAFPEAEALGVEMGGAADHAASLPGLKVIRAEFSALELPPGSVDVITCNHILEHLSDPGAALQKAAALLRPGGVIQVEVPRLDGWGRGWLKRWWWPHMPPQHIQIFSRDGLCGLLARSGFSEIVSARTTGYPGTLSAALVLFFRFTFGSESPYARNFAVRIPAFLLGLCLLLPALLADLLIAPLLDRALGRGDILTVVARRDQ